MPRFRRIWSEHIPLDALAADGALLRCLAARRIQLIFSVQPHQFDDGIRLLRRARELGLAAGMWPLLGDEDGRWLNPDNAETFAGWALRLVDEVEARQLRLDALALDLEPPIDDVRRLLAGERVPVWTRWGRELDVRPHQRILDRAGSAGVAVIATGIPPAMLPGRAGLGWQRALGTPLELGYQQVSAMLYTSLFEGYSRGVLDRRAARALLARFAADTRRRFGRRAGVSLGTAGTGALGDERPYRDVTELAADVALTQRAGIDDITLFDLTGVAGRGAPEPWLDALTTTPPEPNAPEASRRAQALLSTLVISGVALDAWPRADS